MSSQRQIAPNSFGRARGQAQSNQLKDRVVGLELSSLSNQVVALRLRLHKIKNFKVAVILKTCSTISYRSAIKYFATAVHILIGSGYYSMAKYILIRRKLPNDAKRIDELERVNSGQLELIKFDAEL